MKIVSNETDIKLPWPEWKILRPIGRGGFGSVYEAERKVSDTTIARSAVKIINIPFSLEELEEIRFYSGSDNETTKAAIDKIVDTATKEIAALERLKGHPNIVHIEDYAVEKEPISDENIDTYTLYIRQELLKSLPYDMNEEQVLQMGIDICSALKALESIRTDSGMHLLHRDVNPANILVSRISDKEIYKLSDFGIVRETRFNTRITRDTGKTLYTPPEVLTHGIATPTIDIYGLSMSMYVKLNHADPFLNKHDMPFREKRMEAISRRLQGEEIPAPACKNELLSKIVLKGTAFNPEDRYQSASEMLIDLLECHPINSSLNRETHDITYGNPNVSVFPMKSISQEYSRVKKYSNLYHKNSVKELDELLMDSYYRLKAISPLPKDYKEINEFINLFYGDEIQKGDDELDQYARQWIGEKEEK